MHRHARLLEHLPCGQHHGEVIFARHAERHFQVRRPVDAGTLDAVRRHLVDQGRGRVRLRLEIADPERDELAPKAPVFVGVVEVGRLFYPNENFTGYIAETNRGASTMICRRLVVSIGIQ